VPLGRRLIDWSRARYARPGLAGRFGLFALLIVFAVPLYLLVGVWFDLAYAGLGLISRGRLSPPVRAAVSGVLLVALLAAAGATSPRRNLAASDTTALASPTPVVTASITPAPFAGSATSTTPSATATATSSTTVADEDDGATAGDTGPLPSPAASTNPTATAAGRLSGEPRPALTPGAYNPAVTQATIGRTICVSGWTATIRPSSSYTTGLKIQQIVQYGYVDTSTASYEEDHLIPLELGGAPSDLRNLWPEPYVATLPDGRNVGARVKDSFETSLKRAVCAGQITLAAARSRIGVHWVHAYYGIPLAAGATTPPPTARPTPRPTPKPTVAPRPASLSVKFVSLPGPAIPGSTASMTARTSPGAVCSAKVTWPSGTVSAAAGLKTTPTAGSDGLVSWTWNVGPTTKPGTAKAAVTCTLGGSISAVATFSVQ
jgi:hypothetical protein